MKTYLLILLLVPFLIKAQDNKVSPEIQKTMKNQFRRVKLLAEEAGVLTDLGLKIPNPSTSDFGNFVKDDTVYFADKNILRISQAKDGELNGYFIYYYDNKNIYSIAKYKNGNLVDTLKTFFKNGNLKSVRIYNDMLHCVDSTFYDNGKISIVEKYEKKPSNQISGFTDLNETPIESKYYDLEGNEISEKKHRKIVEEYLKTHK